MPVVSLRQKPDVERAEFSPKALHDSDDRAGQPEAPPAAKRPSMALPAEWAQPDLGGPVSAGELLMLAQ